MVVNAPQGTNPRSRNGSASYHRRSLSCVTSEDLSFLPIEEETTAIATGDSSSAGPDGIAHGDNSDGVVSIAAGSLGGKMKLNAPGPRRSLLSDMLNSQNQNSRLEQTAHRRRMIKSMRRYSVDASEMNFNLYPSGRASPMKGIPSEGEEAAPSNGPRTTQEFRDVPTVRYHAAIKTKLIQNSIRRGDDNETPDYFGGEDRVW